MWCRVRATLRVLAVSSLAFAPLASPAAPRGDPVLDAYLSGEPLGAGRIELASATAGPGAQRSLRSRTAGDLQTELRGFLEAFDAAMAGEAPTPAILALEPRFRRVEAHHLLYLSQLEQSEKVLAERGLGATYGGKIGEQRDRYLERISPFFARIASFYALQASAREPAPRPDAEGETEEDLLDRLWRWIQTQFDLYVAWYLSGDLLDDTQEPTRPHLRASTLPYRSRNTAVLAPARPAPVVPSYESEGVEPEVEDLSASPSAPFSDALRLKAEELGYDPIAVFNFVKNEIRTEWYGGAARGAEVTLLSGAGNDVDQASLLVALMRISSVPARFVHGVVEIPIETLRNAFQTELEVEALRGLRAAGVAHEPVIRGGRVAAVKAERTWVAVKLPYSNYRGTLVDPSGSIWLPLDPAFKTLETAPLAPLLVDLGVDAAPRVDAYLAQDRDETLLDQLRVEAKAELDQSGSELEYDDVVTPVPVRRGDTGYLPTTLPYEVEQVSFEGPVLGEALLQHAVFRVYAGEETTSAVILETRQPLIALYNRRVTLSYLPASIDDQEVVRAFGGLLNTPAYLIQVRPQLKFGGQVAATASAGMTTGAPHRLEIELEAPALRETVTKTLLSGSYHALGLTQAQTLLTLDSEESPADTESAGARILSQVALRYHQAWDDAEAELSALAGVTVLRPLPSVTFASNAVDVDFLLDQPQQIVWEGVELDVGLRLIEALSRSTGSFPLPGFYRLAALEGSVLEHHRFESDLLVSAISADRAVALANEAGIEVVTLDAQNVETELLRLAHPDDVKAQIEDWVQQGLTVRAPIAEITFRDWSGFAWIAQDEQTGAAGYFLTGDIAGGATADGTWQNAAAQNALSSPYTPEANEDALAAAAVLVIPASDDQKGTVGELLPMPLQVLVLDAGGRPVVGADVTFQIVAGLGNLGDIGGPTSLSTTTDSGGLADVKLALGTSTGVNPVYVKRESADAFPSQVLETLVDVSVQAFSPQTNDRVVVRPDAPIRAFGFPDEVASLGLFSFASSTAASFAHVFEVTPLDQYGNRISNQEVTFRYLGDTGGSIPGFEAGEVAAGSDNGQEVSSFSSTLVGAFGALVSGNGFVTYDYEIRAGDVTRPVSLTVGRENRVIPFVSSSRDRAIKVGEIHPDPFFITVRRVFPNPDELDIAVYENPTSLGSIEFSVQGDGEVDRFEVDGNQVEYFLRAGPAPAINIATLTTEADFPSEENPLSVTVSGASAPLYGLNPVVAMVEPQPVVVDADNLSLSQAKASYNLAQPGSYAARSLEIILLEDGEEVRFELGDKLSGAGAALFPRAIPFLPGRSYALQLLANRGGSSEVRSDQLPVEVDRKLIGFVQKKVEVAEDVDVLNQRSCLRAPTIAFALNEESRVTIDVTGLGADPGTVVDNEVFGPGDHSVTLDVTRFGEGLFEFTFTADATVRERVETESGDIEVDVVRRAVPPVGHAMYEEIDLFDGGLSLSATDLSIPGRGPPLQFTRSYKSTSVAEGVLGIGWSHNFEQKLSLSNCNSVIARGITFFEDGAGFVPERGQHATLRRDGADFDLYTRDGARWHFRQFPFDKPKTRHLEFIEDTNGNLLKFAYNPQPGKDPELAVVEDSSGRTLEFKYGWIASERRLRRIEGPGEFRVLFFYDTAGRLRRVVRERGSQSKTFLYDYVVDGPQYVPDPEDCPDEQLDCLNQPVPGFTNPNDFLKRGAISRVTNPRGHGRDYTYEQFGFFASHTLNDGTLLNNFVTRIDYPEGASVQLAYSDRIVRTGQLQTTVTDPRDQNTVYEMNQYGSPVSIARPLSTESTVWDEDGILIVQRTDGNDVVTNLEYDENGNVVLEQVVGREPLRWNYEPLRDGTIKILPKTITDRNSNTVTNHYDERGNLIRVDLPDGTSEETVYSSNGDRIRRRDRNGNWTEFAYDEFGNVELKTDALGNVTQNRWNDWGLRLSTVDARGHEKLFRYDDLDRLVEVVDPLGGVRKFTYDENDNKVTETDEENYTITREYDKQDRVVRVVDPEQNEKLFTYDLAGNLLTETDRNENLTEHEYDANNRRTRKIEPEGRITEFDYDPVGNVVEERRQLGRVTKFTYDDFNRKVEVENALLDTVRLVYDDEGNLVSRFDELDRETTFEYDELNRVRFQREPLGRTTETRYDGNGNKTETIDPNGNSTFIEYDSLNRPIVLVDAQGARALTEYDENGNVLRVIDPRGGVTRLEYDELNREIRRTDAEGNVFEKTYDSVGNLVDSVFPNTNVVHHEYDGLRRVLEKSDNLGRLVTNEYDGEGNLVRQVDARGKETVFVYDGLDQLVETREPLTRVSSSEYDFLGNRTTTVDGNENERTFEYDLLDRLVKEVDPDLNEQIKEYDAVGNITTVIDWRGHPTVRRYDDLNRVTEIEDPLNQIATFEYDAVGNVIAETNKRGIVTSNTYDELNRVTTITTDGLLVESREYDETGNLLFSTDANGNTVGFEYDLLNRTVQENRPLAAIRRRTYDSVGDVAIERDPEGRFVVRTYDVRRRLESETINGTTETNGTETTLFEYDEAGNQTRLTKPKTNSWQFFYDDLGRLERLVDPDSKETTYAYDLNDNRTSQTDAEFNTTGFAFDALDRLIRIDYPGSVTESFTYDENGNVATRTNANGVVTTFTYDELDRETLRAYSLPPVPIGTDISEIATLYDANDNVVEVVERYAGAAIPDRTSGFGYDSFDRLVSQTDVFGKTVGYGYDPNGNRESLTDPDGKVSRYALDALNRVTAVTTAAGVSTYSYDRSSRLAQVDYANGAREQRFYDAAGRVSAIENTVNGALVSRFAYDYDLNGNRAEQVETNGGGAETTTYEYDLLDRLFRVSYPDGVSGPATTVEYGYDAVFNRVSERGVEDATG
ncbi:MAG: DUF6531 domain-containing protein, partial [Myxococcota bacterium]|nr:DUF6531 domain-containing protein [Myxococcota bacterium]